MEVACNIGRMGATTFDTLKFVDRLEKAGVPREQAAAMAEAQRDSLAESLDSAMVSKSDVLRLDNRFEVLSKELQALELRLTIKLGAFIAVAAGVLIAVLRLPH